LWNYLDLIQIYSIGIYIDSVIRNEAFRKNGDEFLVHGVVWLCLIGVLKTMNYRIGIFVNALIEILRELIPFGIVTLLLLLGFANLFHVATRDIPSTTLSGNSTLSCEVTNFFSYSTIQKWFLKSITMFLSEEWFPVLEIDDIDDKVLFFCVLYGLVIWILILNVLIAKINNVFSEVDRKGRDAFWQDRVSFVAEFQLIAVILKPLFKIDHICEDKFSHINCNLLFDNNSGHPNSLHINQYDFNHFNSATLSTKELLFNNSKEVSRRFDFSMVSTKEIKRVTTVSERDEFFHWWMKPDSYNQPPLKTRLTFFFNREKFSEILIPGRTFERVLSGNKDKGFYPLTYIFGILFLPFLPIILFIGIPSFGMLWPKPFKEFLFFG